MMRSILNYLKQRSFGRYVEIAVPIVAWAFFLWFDVTADFPDTAEGRLMTATLISLGIVGLAAFWGGAENILNFYAGRVSRQTVWGGYWATLLCFAGAFTFLGFAVLMVAGLGAKAVPMALIAAIMCIVLVVIAVLSFASVTDLHIERVKQRRQGDRPSD